MKLSKLEEIQQSTRVDGDGGGDVGGGRCQRSEHRSRDKHGRDGEAGIVVGDGAIGSRSREHNRGDNERGQSGCFDRSGRIEMRVIGGGEGEGTQGSKEGGGSKQDEEGRGQWLPWMQIVGDRTATPPMGRRS
jgi:hypothetical protein